MKKIIFSLWMFIGILTIYSCNNDDGNGNSGTLPDVAKFQLEAALLNWDSNFGSEVTSNSWSYEGTIDSETERADLVTKLTDVSTNFFPSIKFTDSVLSSATVLKLTDDATITTTRIDAWKLSVDSIVKLDQHIVKINWNRPSGDFISYCLLNASEIVYDNMLLNAVFIRPSNSCFSERMWWIWEDADEGTRGSIFADLTPNCVNGVPVTCDKNCTASMTAGEASINCTATIVDNCCQMEYSWAWACGFKSVKVAADNFTLEIEGIIGSSGSGNGSCTRCCE